MASPCHKARCLLHRVALMVTLWLATPSDLALAQHEGEVHYFKQRSFEIPCSAGTAAFRRLHLHVSTDEGKTYSPAGSTLQRAGSFHYTARADGWYFFLVQVEEVDGSFTPARVQLAKPHLRVCVDTEKPQAALVPVVANPRDGNVAVQWSVRDPNLDLQTLRLEYRSTSGGRWIPLNHRQMERAQFAWFANGPGPFDVRLLINDKAENVTEVTTQVRLDGVRAGAGGGGYTGTPPNTGDRKVIFVNKKSFKLTYKLDGIGPSRVKHVEVWQTRDTTAWGPYRGSEAPPDGPYEITVPVAGRYGFTLRPISGVGRGPAAPRAGDLPQVWVEVDLTAPTVQLHTAHVIEKEDAKSITVSWRAEDRFFGDQPITILFAENVEGPWKVLQANVENTGTCKCSTEGLPFEFFVRVEATDRAGNKAHAQTRETVKVDLSTPRVIDVNVTTTDQSNKPRQDVP